MWVESRDIALHDARRIVRRIDRNEHDTYVRSLRCRQRTVRTSERCERERTLIGAMCVSEEKKLDGFASIEDASRPAVTVGKRKIRCNLGRAQRRPVVARVGVASIIAMQKKRKPERREAERDGNAQDRPANGNSHLRRRKRRRRTPLAAQSEHGKRGRDAQNSRNLERKRIRTRIRT